jgi:protein gp37
MYPNLEGGRMSDGTSIEWTEATWNPITGCSVLTPGCTNCYAMKLAGTRLRNHSSRAGLTRDTKAGPVWTGEVRFNEQWLDQPLRWSRPRMIFVAAHGDLFHESVPDEWIDRVFAVMALARQHTFQVLTKRAKRMRDYLLDFGTLHRVAAHAFALTPDDRAPFRWNRDHIWLGVSVEDQARADERVPLLLDTPAAVRWISAEPLLGPVDLVTCWGLPPPDLPFFQAGTPLCTDPLCARGRPHYPREFGCRWGKEPKGPRRLDWVVAGGESGPGARPMHPVWVRSLRDQCAAAGVPFFFKQWGEHEPRELIVDDRPEHWRRNPAGFECWFLDEFGTADVPPVRFSAVGKKRAGRLLDGVTHNAHPAR